MLLLFISCSPSADKIVDYKTLVGEWALNSETQINYPLIEFKSDSTAIFKSKADTIYRYNFVLKGDTLILINSFNVKSINKINFLNNQKLIFNKLLEHKTRQVYKKATSRTN